jgi:outer membrane biogenesis lipoprotein LolB
MKRLSASSTVFYASAALLLSGCGAEVAGTAAAVGSLQAQQASQARQQQAQVVEGLKAAQATGLARAASAVD